MAAVAMRLVVLLITGSATHASTVAALEVLPFLLLSVPVGILVDRSPRRLLLAAASLASLLGTAAVAVAYAVGALSMGVIYAAAVVWGVAGVVVGVAQVAALPRLVPK